MIVLYGNGPDFGLPAASPYVMKAEVLLKMAGLAYRNEAGTPTESPKGQIPFIDDGGTRIGDTTFIRAHIEQRYGFDFDAGLSKQERAQAWALERMIENHYGWTNSHARWLIQANFEKGPAHWFDSAPEAQRARLRADAQKRIADNLRAVGIGRHSPDEIAGLAERSLSALSVLLGDKAYLMGGRPAGVDATALGALASALTPFFESPQRRKAESFPNLVAYTGRMMKQYYPKHPWPAG